MDKAVDFILSLVLQLPRIFYGNAMIIFNINKYLRILSDLMQSITANSLKQRLFTTKGLINSTAKFL